MKVESLHSWLIARKYDEVLYALDESDRFGPFVLISEQTDSVIAPNMSRADAVAWLVAKRLPDEAEAQRYLSEEISKWMVRRAARAWSLRTAKPAAMDSCACGQ